MRAEAEVHRCRSAEVESDGPASSSTTLLEAAAKPQLLADRLEETGGEALVDKTGPGP
ncbi:hypothetical protein [Streptomyces avermitilis]|uniref:hypothetical protein n=1 Tax=Streptomyces avermitilis TaxID=33903 RepID=UPI0037F6AA65